MPCLNQLRVVEIKQRFDDSGLIVQAIVAVHVENLSSDLDFDSIDEDTTMSMAESVQPNISEQVRRKLTEQWPGRSYSIRWPMLLV